MAKILSILEQLSLIFAESQEHLSFSQVLLVLQKEKKSGYARRDASNAKLQQSQLASSADPSIYYINPYRQVGR